MSKKIVRLSIAILICSMAFSANLVTNGGFETGDFTAWTILASGAGAPNYTCVVAGAAANVCGTTQSGANYVNSGSYGTFLGYSFSQSLDSLYQDITFSGLGGPTMFDVSYYMRRLNDTVTVVNAASWTASLGGTPLAPTSTATSNTPFILYSYQVLIAGSGTQRLQFDFYNLLGEFALDDVRVESQIPEPATAILMGLPLTALYLLRRRRR